MVFTSKTNGNAVFFPLSDNGSDGSMKLMSNELWITNQPYIWMYGSWWGSPATTAGFDIDGDFSRWYIYKIRPVFTAS